MARLELVSAPPPEERGELLPEINQEIRRTVVDVIRREAPTTVLGLLMQNEPLTIGALTGLLGKDYHEVEWTVAMLREEGLCLASPEEGIVKYKAVALYTEPNE
jgi:predicted transcriptional regulator